MLLTALISLPMLSCRQPEESDLPFYNSADFTPVFIGNKNEVTSEITHKIGAFSFLDQDSVLISDKTLQNKIHVAGFMFTSCKSICPMMTRNLKIVSDAFENDGEVFLLSYSVTPWIDTPGILNAYKKGNGIRNQNWHFLTGDKAAIYSLARKSYFAEEELGLTKDSTEFLHTEHCILVDRDSRIRGVYNSTLALEMRQLIKDIEVLKKQ